MQATRRAGASWLGDWRWSRARAADVIARLRGGDAAGVEMVGARALALAEACLIAQEEAAALNALRMAPATPRHRALSAVARLRRDADAKAAMELFAAAREAPQLFSLLAREITTWLEGPGAAHDSVALRAELERLRALHAQGAAWRASLPAREHYRCLPAGEDIEECVAAVLRRHAEVLRHAWVVRRECRHMRRWPHLDIVLDVRPRLWLRRATHPRSLARALARRVLGELLEAVDAEATLHVRATPDEVPLWLLRRLRARARDLLAPPSATRPIRRAPRRAGNVAARAVVPRVAATLSLAPPVLAAFFVVHAYLDNERTHAAMHGLAASHAHHLGARPWRHPSLEDEATPARVLRLFRAARQARDSAVDLPIYTTATRARLRARPLSRARLELEARLLESCGAARIRVWRDRAVAWYPRDTTRCPPLFMMREEGRWRMDHAALLQAVRVEESGEWRLRDWRASGYGFAFPLSAPAPWNAAFSRNAASAPALGRRFASLLGSTRETRRARDGRIDGR